ncbi:uncharacterized protein LOC106178076 [Lingula anatina]|uniref:Uncharacterized protein LOC106178076 n=1 Tax=Lingula anatina TaxID=7574 RepID=A0A1S3K1P5_LINAN|nr:uncharacterized protein LOC106178076 [Lingula anatina]|eukprot:XP_013416550.1 uncharacterized protein LOC106178076 [Lingula anatina]
MAGAVEVPGKMLALMKREAGESFKIETIPVPNPQGDEVLIKVDANAICGSDINLYRWNEIARVIAALPFTPGHETTGTVVRCGPEATIKEGQRVCVENHYFCGKCYQCEHQNFSICRNMNQYGHGKGTPHGGCSEYSIVPSKYCYQLKTNISPAEAACLEPMGVAHNAIERLEVEDEDVLVIGCGPIGVLVIAVAKAMGARRVFGADINPRQLDLAKQMGADDVINTSEHNLRDVIMEKTNGNGIGRICECSGAPPAVNTLWTSLRKGGNVVLIGLPKQPIHIEDPLTNVVFKAVQIRTVHGRSFNDFRHTWEECERLVAEGKVKLRDVITHEFPMSKFEDAFQTLFSGKACKIVIYPQQ